MEILLVYAGIIFIYIINRRYDRARITFLKETGKKMILRKKKE